MSRHLTKPEREEFLAAPHVAVLSVASGSDRPPLTTPLWYAYQPGGDITFFTGTQGRKTRKVALLKAAGVLALCVQQEEYPYKYVTVEGRLRDIHRPPTADQMLTVARRYLPEPAAHAFVAAELDHPSNELVLFAVHPERWFTFNFAGDLD